MEVAEFQGRAMASRLHIIATADRRADGLDAAISEAVSYVNHLEQCWSRFLSSSDVSRLNQLGPKGGVLRVDPSTVTLLQSMITGHQVTAGRFDPTLVRELIAEGYGASHVDSTSITGIADGVTRPGALFDLEADPKTSTISVPAGLVLDAGGIGKGLAADLVVARLLDIGVAGAMVEIGGDLAMGGSSPDPFGWLVDVEHPDPSDGILCSLAISGGGVATSSVRSRRWIRDRRERHHHIDPRTGMCSTTDLAAVTVIAPAGWLAEVHGTAALAVGSENVVSYLEGHGLAGIAVVVDDVEDVVLRTSTLDGIIMNDRSRVG